MADLRTKEAQRGPTPDLKTPEAAALWAAAGNLGTFTAPELAEASDIADATVKHTVARWEIEGFLRKSGKGRNGAQAFAFVNERSRPYGPLETRLWQTMRHLRTFSVRDLALASSVEDGAVSEDEAERFLNMLIAEGYARVRHKAVKGKSPARFLLVRDTGPRPPFKRRITVFVDPNTSDVLLPEAYR